MSCTDILDSDSAQQLQKVYLNLVKSKGIFWKKYLLNYKDTTKNYKEPDVNRRQKSRTR